MNILLWPFKMIWTLISFFFELTGRFLGIVLGFILMSIGIVLCFTLIGAIVGIPLGIFGVLLMIRALFKP